ncbi:MAG: protoporphyrinogen oxidase [Planctomycetes bacterium]|nr:protoporphyrinogen oxidase [Planctomycetota bacterium]
MNAAPAKQRHIVVVGGGISGLAAAYAAVSQARIRGDNVRVTLLNAGERFGGVIRTTYKDGYVLDEGPDCFISTKPEALQLVKELGIEDQLINTQDAYRQSFILSKGRLQPVPKGFFLLAPTSLDALKQTPLLSWPGKIRAAMDFIIPRRTPSQDFGDDESLTSFVTRRLGAEVHDRIAQPMVAGIYTADPEKLSLRATFPDFLNMERDHGSVIRGMLAPAKTQSEAAGTRGASQASGARYSMFRSMRLGMGQLVDELRKFLEPLATLRRNAVVAALQPSGKGYRLRLAGGEVIEADQVVLALPARTSAKLLRGSGQAQLRRLGASLRQTGYASAATVSLAYNEGQVRHACNGMGFVVPAIEGRQLLACSFSHHKWPSRAPAGKVLLRAFLGGALQHEMVGLKAAELAAIAHRELAEILGIRGEPELTHVAKWRNAMAQYHVGHVDRVEAIRALEAQIPNLALAGNGFDGVGIPDCIRNAKRAVKSLFEG